MAKKNDLTTKNDSELTELIRITTLSCYGVSDVESYDASTKKGKKEGIILYHNADKTISTDIYVSLVDGVKVTEVLRSAQQTVRFVVDKKFPKLMNAINIYALRSK